MYKKIMIVVDEGAAARSALYEGLELARSNGAAVQFFHVVPNYVLQVADSPQLVALTPQQHHKDVHRLAGRLMAQAAEAARQLGVRSASALGSNLDAATCIARAAKQYDCELVAIGSHGRSSMQRLIFGSVVAPLIQLSHVPVLVCKAGEQPRTVPLAPRPLQRPRAQREKTKDRVKTV